MKNFQNDIVDMEEMLDLSAPIQSATVPRWQRKASEKLTPRKTPRRTAKRTPLSKKKSATKSDRFIPNRSAMDFDLCHYSLTHDENSNADEKNFKKSLAANLLGQDSLEKSSHRVLSFRNKPPVPAENFQDTKKVLYTYNKFESKPKAKSTRHISSAPVRILDAPELVDDYYLNLISWSCNNVLAVALGQAVYLWDAATGSIEELMSVDDDNYITSVSWIQQGGSHLAIGTSSADVQLWDASAQKQVRSMNGHQSRVGSLAWNSHILSSGSRDSSIIHHDVRIQNHQVGTLIGHQQEICGLTWSPDGTTLASGGNDNLLCLWDAAQTGTQNQRPAFIKTEHDAAVKALAWCPWERNLLASGGGTADRTIKFWNSSNGALLNSVDTGSQVCSLLWSNTEKELLSSHGYSQNELCLWKYPSMTKIKEFHGHSARVLHLAGSPDGSTVVSAAADETLRFWNIFASARSSKKESSVTRGSFTSIMGIR